MHRQDLSRESVVVIARTEVQFPDRRDLDAAVAQLVHPAPGNAAIGSGAVPAADIVNVVATRHGSTRRNADGRRSIGILETRSSGGEPVQIRRLDNGVAGAAQRVLAVLIRDDDQEVVARGRVHFKDVRRIDLPEQRREWQVARFPMVSSLRPMSEADFAIQGTLAQVARRVLIVRRYGQRS